MGDGSHMSCLPHELWETQLMCLPQFMGVYVTHAHFRVHGARAVVNVDEHFEGAAGGGRQN